MHLVGLVAYLEEEVETHVAPYGANAIPEFRNDTLESASFERSYLAIGSLKSGFCEGLAASE
jgi:hypothetical protein